MTLSSRVGVIRGDAPVCGFGKSLAYRFVRRPGERMQPFGIDRHMDDGDTLPVAGGLAVIAIPGHCAGRVALLWQGRRLLIAGDVGTDILGIGDPAGFENEAEGRRSQRKIAALPFDAVAFGHGRIIRAGGVGACARGGGRQVTRRFFMPSDTTARVR